MGHKKSRFEADTADDDLLPGKGKHKSKKQGPHKEWDEIEEEWGDWSDDNFDDRD